MSYTQAIFEKVSLLWYIIIMGIAQPKENKIKKLPFGKKRKNLRMRGVSDTSVLKEQIQAKLRELVIKRDGGCILRDYPDTGKCDNVLQAEHLNSRTHSISFADSRLAVCLCRRHHIFWKPQNSARYWEIVEEMIGAGRWDLFQKVKADRMSHKVDMKMALIYLSEELKLL